jgi:endonuclease/exonuclease/phosphatase family metal-dependent hydrolase
MRLATWNIYWLGDREDHIQRTESDHQLIAQVIRKLSPDVLALEEIVDPLVMEHILSLANGDGRDYVIRVAESHWLSSDAKPLDTTNNLQKLFLCINKQTIDFVEGSVIRGGPGGRRPYAARLRDRSSGQEFVVAGLHLRSGFPIFLDEADAAVRKKEVAALIRWLQGEAGDDNPDFREPNSDYVAVLGDYNAQIEDENESLAALGGLNGWLWTNPEPDGAHRETALYESDRFVIDFILLSGPLHQRMVRPPGIYAWDYDPDMGGATKFHEGPTGMGDLKGYGVSDHRPVFTDLDFGT